LFVHDGNSCRSNNHFNIKIDLIEFIGTTSKSLFKKLSKMVGSNLSGFTNPEKIQYLLQLWETSRYLHLIKKKNIIKVY